MRVVVELNVDMARGLMTARVPDVPVVGEGETEDEAVKDLKRAFMDYIQREGLEATLSRFRFPSAIRHLDWDVSVPQAGNGA